MVTVLRTKELSIIGVEGTMLFELVILSTMDAMLCRINSVGVIFQLFGSPGIRSNRCFFMLSFLLHFIICCVICSSLILRIVGVS